MDGVLVGPRHGDGYSVIGVPPRFLQEYLFEPHFEDFATGVKPMMPFLESVLRSAGLKATALDVLGVYLDAGERLNHGVLDAAREWKAATGGGLHLATNQEEIRAEYLWDGIGLREHFDGMQASSVLGAMKPQAEFFERATAAIGAGDPASVLFIDDNPANVAAAVAHGWQAVCADAESEIVSVIRSLLPEAL